MSVAKIIELTATSTVSFEDAVREAVERASKTLQNISGAWVEDQEVIVENGKIAAFKVRVKVTFVLND